MVLHASLVFINSSHKVQVQQLVISVAQHVAYPTHSQIYKVMLMRLHPVQGTLFVTDLTKDDTARLEKNEQSV